MRQITRFLLKNVKKQTGSSLAEMMVVTGIMGIVGIGIATLMTNLTTTQQKTNVVAALAQRRQIVMDNLLDGKAWANTIQASDDDLTAPHDASHLGTVNRGLGCLKAQPLYDCINGATTFKDKLNNNLANMHVITNLKNTSNVDVNDPTHGFNSMGAPCTGFDGVNGNNACPFRYNIGWIPVTNTKNPQVRIIANLQFKPATTTFFPVFNEINYAIDLVRGANVRNDPLLIVHEQPALGVVTGAPGGGGCDASSGPPRNINAYVKRTTSAALGYQIKENIGGNVISTTADSFTLGPGTYNCRISAPAFGIQGTKLKIAAAAAAGDTSMVSSGATEGPGSYASFSPSTGTVAQFDVSITLSVNTALSVYQYCQIANNAYDLGLPIGGGAAGYSATVFTQIRCVRTS